MKYSYIKDHPQRHKNVYFNIIAPIGPILKIEDHFPKQFRVVDSESGVRFYLVDLLHGEKRLQSRLPIETSRKHDIMQKILFLKKKKSLKQNIR